MHKDLSDIERAALREFIAVHGTIKTVLLKFAARRKQEMDSTAAEALRLIPRQLEQACDSASKAEVYGSLLSDLERFANQN